MATATYTADNTVEKAMIEYGSFLSHEFKDVSDFLAGKSKLRPIRLPFPREIRKMNGFSIIRFNDSLALTMGENDRVAHLSDLTSTLDISLARHFISADGLNYGTPYHLVRQIRSEGRIRAYDVIMGMHHESDTLFLPSFVRMKDRTVRSGNDNGPGLPKGWGFGF